jgi:hypothetical protein
MVVRTDRQVFAPPLPQRPESGFVVAAVRCARKIIRIGPSETPLLKLDCSTQVFDFRTHRKFTHFKLPEAIISKISIWNQIFKDCWSRSSLSGIGASKASEGMMPSLTPVSIRNVLGI